MGIKHQEISSQEVLDFFFISISIERQRKIQFSTIVFCDICQEEGHISLTCPEKFNSSNQLDDNLRLGGKTFQAGSLESVKNTLTL